MKRLSLFMLCVLLLISSCAKKADGGEGVVFTDDKGREVTVSSPERVASLIGSLAQIWMLSGGDVVAAADDAWDDLALDLSEDTVNLGKINNLSMEKLIQAKPDFVIASPNIAQDVSWKETIEAMGIPVAYFEVYTFSDYLRILDIFTDITGRKDLYSAYGEKVEKVIEEVLEKKRTDSPKVLSLLASTSYLKAKNSSSSVMGAMLKDLGCINLADSESSLIENLSIEYILQEDPEYIFITQRGDDTEGMKKAVEKYFQEHPLWYELSAVKEGKVFFMDKNLYNLKPNNRWGEAYRILQEIMTDES